jgi:hypothetical protein
MLHVERIGGLAGFGGTASHIRSRGQVDETALSDSDKKSVEELFRSQRSQGTAKPKTSQMPDAFRYRISRDTPAGSETVEVPESLVPKTLTQSVKDELI